MPAPLTVLVDSYPVLSETFVTGEVAALRRLGHDVHVECGARGAATAPAPDGVMTDDGVAQRLGALAWLVARHPRRCVADRRARARWAQEDAVRPLRELAPAARRAHRHGSAHLHAHFAAGAGLDALRLSRLLGLPYSVTAHANDIYAHPRNLREKLERAAFATSGCAYTVDDLRRLAPRADVHEVVMGVDTDAFAPAGPAPGRRTVCAIGRLVEKKGFATLVEAAARIEPPVDVEIVGDGPQRGELAALIGRTGAPVRLLGALEPAAVRDVIARCDILAAPCVVAPDGDRDSAPLVVKEALAMERLVVASDEVGLPEFVRRPWGRLHLPGDAAGLAAALSELLDLTPEDRAAAAAAGRAFVAEEANVDVETAKLSALIAVVAR